MQMSAFDTSHQPGAVGTHEILIPRDAAGFFPPLPTTGNPPEQFFDVSVNTPTGITLGNYRFWYYRTKREFRLRPDLQGITLNQIQPGGGTILAVNRLPAGSNPAYEVTIVNATDPQHATILALCNRTARRKRWGVH
jgi:hypothetical protein